MIDEDFLGLLAVPVNAAVPLLHAVGVPGDLVMDQPAAVVLEVDTFRGGVRGLLEEVVVSVLLLNLVDLTLENAEGWFDRGCAAFGCPQRLLVLFQGRGK